MSGQQAGEIKKLDEYLESTLESVDDAEDSVLKVAQEIGFEEEDLHKIGMAVREGMVNAVVHGNAYNAQKKVRLAAWQGQDYLAVEIVDEGQGFDMSVLPDPLAEENLLRQSGRGILLIQAFMDEFQVRRAQPAGTEVRIVKYLNQK